MTVIFPFVETAPREHRGNIFFAKVVFCINSLDLIVFIVSFKNVKEIMGSKVLTISVYVPYARYSDMVFT